VKPARIPDEVLSMAGRIARPALKLTLPVAAGVAVLGVIGCSGLGSESSAQTASRGNPAKAVPTAPLLQPVVPPELATPRSLAEYAAHDATYPFYMPMQGLRRPANRFFVKCDASQAAGREVYQATTPLRFTAVPRAGGSSSMKRGTGPGGPASIPSRRRFRTSSATSMARSISSAPRSRANG